jgi:dienelactone hydrolase
MKKILILFLFIIVFGIIFITPFFQRLFWSVLVLSELLNFESRGWMEHWSTPPDVSLVIYRGPFGPVKADLYLPPQGGSRPGILLNHGVVDTGKDDPRLKRFAEILCRAGFVVFVPEFQGMRSFRVSPTDADEIQSAYEAFLSRKERRSNTSCGLFGFSYGAGPAIIAASRPAIREKVRFLVSFGGYYDLQNVLTFIATGHFEFEGKKYFRQPQEYGKWVFLANNLDWVRSPEDRLILKRIVQKKLQDEKIRIDSFFPLLGPEGRTILDLLTHTEPAQTEKFLKEMPAEIRAVMDSLSVAAALKNLNADMILAHGEDDDLIPFTETLRLSQNAPDPKKVYLQILKSYTHMDPEKRGLSLKNLFAYHLPETWKLFGLVYRLMKYRHEQDLQANP